jgi:hypothetical protein
VPYKTVTSKTKNLVLEGIPRDLFDEALKLCRAQEPPLPLKWKIVELVREWVSRQRKSSTGRFR